jgi:hypothetical protein
LKTLQQFCSLTVEGFSIIIISLIWKLNQFVAGHVNGVNVIGLSLQPTVPQIPAPSLRPPLMHQASTDFTSLQVQQLQPRRPTTGNVDLLLPLQPELLLGNINLQLILCCYKMKWFFRILPEK